MTTLHRRAAGLLAVALALDPTGSAAAQGAPVRGTPCGDMRSVLNAPLVGTMNLQAAWTPAEGRRLLASTDMRLEALAAGNQCVEEDLRDPALQLRRHAALTNDLPLAPLAEPPVGGQRTGLWVRGRASTRVDPSGRYAATYDLALGAWRDFGPFVLTTSVREVEIPVSRARIIQRPSTPNPLECDTCGVDPLSSSIEVDSSGKLASRRARELVVSATTWWSGVAFGVNAGVGIATADGARRWVSGEAAIPVGQRLDVVMLARAASRQVSPAGHELGAMLRYHLGRASVASRPPAPRAPVTFRAEPTGRRNVVQLVIHAGHASSVAIRGDFTEWREVSLAPVGHGDWAVELPVEAGMHQLLMRLDGGTWEVPPGLPVAPDGFGDRVGVVRIGQ